MKRPTLRKLCFWISTGLSALTLILVVANSILFLGNQSRQGEVSQRQQFINQTAQLSQLSDSLVRALAKQAIDNKDDKLLDLLAENGIGVPAAATPSPAPAPPSPSSATDPAARNKP